MHNLLFLQNIGAGEIIVIALVVLLLFGGKKIPELMHGIGKGVRSFKEGVNDIEKDIDRIGETSSATKKSEPEKKPAEAAAAEPAENESAKEVND